MFGGSYYQNDGARMRIYDLDSETISTHSTAQTNNCQGTQTIIAAVLMEFHGLQMVQDQAFEPTTRALHLVC